VDGGDVGLRSLRTAAPMHRPGQERQLPIAGRATKNVTLDLWPDAPAIAHAQAERAGG